MAKSSPQPKVLTGNRLRDGHTVYYTGSDWSPYVTEAKVAHDAAEAEALAKIGAAAYAANQVVDVAVVDVNAAEPTPVRLRELIRATGPTVRPDLNKPISRQA
jgi:hypothetical protein